MAEHGADVTGVIAGFDRLRLRESLRWLYQPSFMKRYLCEARVLLKDFGAYATGVSNRICAAAHAFLVSPEIGYSECIGLPPARSPPTKKAGHAHRAAAVRPPATQDHAAPPLGLKYNLHKRCRPAAVIRDGLIQPESGPPHG